MGTSYEVFSPDHHPGRADRDGTWARRSGRDWLVEARSAIHVVPSVVARMERNLIVSNAHPDFAAIRNGPEAPIWWDDRLFAR